MAWRRLAWRNGVAMTYAKQWRLADGKSIMRRMALNGVSSSVSNRMYAKRGVTSSNKQRFLLSYHEAYGSMYKQLADPAVAWRIGVTGIIIARSSSRCAL